MNTEHITESVKRFKRGENDKERLKTNILLVWLVWCTIYVNLTSSILALLFLTHHQFASLRQYYYNQYGILRNTIWFAWQKVCVCIQLYFPKTKTLHSRLFTRDCTRVCMYTFLNMRCILFICTQNNWQIVAVSIFILLWNVFFQVLFASPSLIGSTQLLKWRWSMLFNLIVLPRN